MGEVLQWYKEVFVYVHIKKPDVPGLRQSYAISQKSG
jgi:hypothetical protein